MKPSEILREAVKLNWTQCAFARKSDGFETSFDDPKASCFCSLGRIYRITGDERESNARARLYLRRTIGEFMFIPEWNDAPGRTREEVDAAFLKAAELAEKEGQ